MSLDTPKQVEIYVIFCKLGSVNTIQGKYEGEVDVVSSWLDNIQGKYDSANHWNPQLVFENLIEKDSKIRTKIEVKSLDDQQENNSTRIIQYQKIIGAFSEWLNVKEFPFDIQKIGVVISSLHPMSHINLIGKQEYCYLSKKATRENDNWDFNQTVSIEYSTYQEHTPYLRSQQYEMIKFNALVARKSQFYITNLLLPLFFVTTTIFVSFTHNVEAISTRLSACATTLLTSINFRFVIHGYLPNVPYSTYLDVYSMASIIFITVVFCWHAYNAKKLHGITYAELDLYVVCIFAGIYIVGHIIFIIFAWILPKRRQKIFIYSHPHSTTKSAEEQPIELENLLGYERSFDKIPIDEQKNV